MKATLKFDLPEEAFEHRLALDGGKWMQVCHELDQWLRSLEKYQDRDSVKVAEVRSRIHEEMESSGLNFD